MSPLPGSVPADNHRPLSVKAVYDGLPLVEFFATVAPTLSLSQWRDVIVAGRVHVDDRRCTDPDRPVRGGNRLVHTIPDEVEPDVSGAIRWLWEDDHLLAVNKPAPLPMHPSGRFKRNTLTSMLELAWPGTQLYPVHRLDAETSGLVLFARSPMAARGLGLQFEARTVEKVYLAVVRGEPPGTKFSCDLAISDRPTDRGTRVVGGEGLEARTEFAVVGEVAEGVLLQARPRSGRTNQIRVHLAALGLPIVGDEAYGAGGSLTATGGLRLHHHRLCFEHPILGAPLAMSADAPAWAQG